MNWVSIVVLAIAVVMCFVCMFAGRSDDSRDVLEDDEDTWLCEEEEDDED